MPKYSPLIMDVEAKSYSWCSCGLSQKQPFCDGTHGSTGLFPKVVRFEEKKKVAWCMCKATSTPPFCDGTHKTVS
ncbi:MAG: CDGSH iron-sulfur domain-containing protein [Candidatus Omnitrophota bacterium]|nr:CDGSH iron-sulfur domain-containing protein [Candidatus Omnitrophota bacterium]MDZ4241776.1 CDGSH iron-sulfur domain-containing protein [Candidatus Omnitrophota bacterium]